MNTADRIFWLHALTPLHVGRGRGEGYIDLPLAREQVTNFPYVPGSSVKGVIADRHGATVEGREDQDGDDETMRTVRRLRRQAFGRADDEQGSGSNAGALVFTDARLVCLPVRSLYGTFAWCTSPLVLRRLTRDLQAVGMSDLPPAPAELGEACHVPGEPQSALANEGRVFLEDLDIEIAPCDVAGQWADRLAGWVFPDENDQRQPWQDEFRKRFAVLPDDVFNFLCETGTEVQAHIRIEEETKRVAQGALWYEESLPAETLLAGIVWCDPIARDLRDDMLLTYCTEPCALQVGGKSSVGKGRVACLFTPGEE